MNREYRSDLTVDEWARLIAEWRKEKRFDTGWDNWQEKLLLMVDELMEAMRKMRERQIPIGSAETVIEHQRDAFREELADGMIRILDFLGSTTGESVGAILVRLMKENEERPIQHGKRF